MLLAAEIGMEDKWVCHTALGKLDPHGKQDTHSHMGIAPSIFREPCEEALAEESSSKALETQDTK